MVVWHWCSPLYEQIEHSHNEYQSQSWTQQYLLLDVQFVCIENIVTDIGYYTLVSDTLQYTMDSNSDNIQLSYIAAHHTCAWLVSNNVHYNMTYLSVQCSVRTPCMVSNNKNIYHGWGVLGYYFKTNNNTVCMWKVGIELTAGLTLCCMIGCHRFHDL